MTVGLTGVSTNALSLAEYAIQSNDPLVQAVTMSLLENGTVLDDIPLTTNPSLLANGVRWEGNLPGVNWVKVNAEGTAVKGQPTPFQESAFIVRNYIDVDKYLVLDKNQIQDPRAIQTAAYLKSFAYDFNDKFINNAHDTGDANAVVGLRTRIDNPTIYGVKSVGATNYQKLNGYPSTTAITATTAMVAADANNLIEAIDLLIWSVGGGDTGAGVVLYMNEVMKRRFARAIRLLGAGAGFDTTRDNYGRTFDMYRQAEVRDIGYKADQVTRIIPVVETAAGAATGGTSTSIYGVRYGDSALMGWQFAPLNVQDLGITENGVVYRTLLDWAGGLYPTSNRSFARLYNVNLG